MPHFTTEASLRCDDVSFQTCIVIPYSKCIENLRANRSLLKVLCAGVILHDTQHVTLHSESIASVCKQGTLTFYLWLGARSGGYALDNRSPHCERRSLWERRLERPTDHLVLEVWTKSWSKRLHCCKLAAWSSKVFAAVLENLLACSVAVIALSKLSKT